MATVTGPLIVKTNNSFMGKTFVNGTTSVRFSDKTSNFFKLHSHKHSGVQSFRLANRKTITIQAGCKDSSLLIATTKTNSFHNSLMKKEFPRMVKAAATKASPGKKEEKWSHEGLITESLPNGMFRVQLDNEDTIIGYVSGKIRRSFIRILPGDRVKVEITRYDSTRGRIIYRLRNNESKV